jgi:hypothetical protein
MTVKEAAKLVGKDERTIKRWKAQGLSLENPAEILDYSSCKDARSRGKTCKTALVRHAVTGLRRHFPAVIDQSDIFIELPSPLTAEQAAAAWQSLSFVHGAFARRVEELKGIGHLDSIDSAKADLEAVTESLRLLDITLEGFGA